MLVHSLVHGDFDVLLVHTRDVGLHFEARVFLDNINGNVAPQAAPLHVSGCRQSGGRELELQGEGQRGGLSTAAAERYKIDVNELTQSEGALAERDVAHAFRC